MAESVAPVVAHISPHPDDSALGAPMTLALLQRHGWRVVDILVSQGRTGTQERRLAEWHKSLERSAFEGIPIEPPLRISSTDDPQSTEAEIGDALSANLRDLDPAIVVSPQVHDAHPGHELVARAVRRSLEGQLDQATWWMYGIWSAVQPTNIYAPFDEEALQQALYVLEAFEGELDRLDYTAHLRGHALSARVDGSATVTGSYGLPHSPLPYAELLMEVVQKHNTWVYGSPRVLDIANVLAAPTTIDITEILDRPSNNAILARASRNQLG